MIIYSKLYKHLVKFIQKAAQDVLRRAYNQEPTLTGANYGVSPIALYTRYHEIGIRSEQLAQPTPFLSPAIELTFKNGAIVEGSISQEDYDKLRERIALLKKVQEG